jgi:diacylglycerol kinase family enzyme
VEPRGAEGEQGEWSRLDEFLDQSTLYILYNTGSGGTHSDLPLLLADLKEQFSSTSFEATNMIEADQLADTIRRIRSDPSGRVLVIGGDGTIAWALQLMLPDAETPMNLVNASPTSDRTSCGACPPVAIWPGGTGNDLARVLGWGHKVNCVSVLVLVLVLMLCGS